MSGHIATLDDPLLRDRPPAALRAPQDKDTGHLPADLHIVSADGHWEISEDIFYAAFPDDQKHLAPRVWFDRFWHSGYPDKMPTDADSRAFEDRVAAILELSVPSGAWDIKLRTAHLDAEGIEKEIIFPQSLLQFLRHPDLAVQERIYGTYNEYIARVCAAYPGRYYGVGVCRNWWDPARAHAAIRQIVDLGLKTYMIPSSNPGKTADGKPISYGGVEMDRFWAEAADAGLPVNFHIGENASLLGRGAQAAWLLQAMAPFRKPLGEMIFGGVFDRHPDLQVVFSEGGIAWVPPALQDAEMIYDAHLAVLDYVPKHRPSHYWAQNCHATFQSDPIGLRLIDCIGVGRILWAADYPHNEGTFGYSGAAVRALIDRLGEADARKVLGGNARALFKL